MLSSVRAKRATGTVPARSFAQRRCRSATFVDQPPKGSSLNYLIRFPKLPAGVDPAGSFVVSGVVLVADASAALDSYAVRPALLSLAGFRADWRCLRVG